MTGCGYSERGEVGDIFGQGSGGAAKVSALNLSRKLETVFQDSEELSKYGSIKQEPYSFQDDVLIPVNTIEDLLSVNVKMTAVMKTMQTRLNKTKSGYNMMGPRRLVEEARWRLTLSPALCGDFVMREVGQEKWLGDMFAGGLKESVMATIRSREGKVRRAAYEILNIVHDYRAQRVGGFCSGLLLWESCCIPSLIYNCSTWVGMGREEEKVLNQCQDFFLRLMWATGPGAPRVALRADLGTRSMESRVWQQKILLVHHMARLEEGDLARMMLEAQRKNDWPGLAQEVAGLCRWLELEDASTTRLDNKIYKKEVAKACKYMDETNMKREMERMKLKKMKIMIDNDCELKDYVKNGNVYSARKAWEVKSFMLRVAGNYPAHKKYESTGWRCQACPYMVREDQDHLTHCSGYSDLRIGADFDNDEELIKFYRKVMKRREDNGWD